MDPILVEVPYVNMITVTPILPPSQKMENSDISFTLPNAPYYGELTPLYIPAKLNGQTIMDVMVYPLSSQRKPYLYLNGIGRDTIGVMLL